MCMLQVISLNDHRMFTRKSKFGKRQASFTALKKLLPNITSGVGQRLLHLATSNHSLIHGLVSPTSTGPFIITTLLELPIKNVSFLWPDMEGQAPGILLSIGSSWSQQEKERGLQVPEHTKSRFIVLTIFWMLKLHGTSSSKRFESQMRSGIADT
jgi:hypothetical protein